MRASAKTTPEENDSLPKRAPMRVGFCRLRDPHLEPWWNELPAWVVPHAATSVSELRSLLRQVVECLFVDLDLPGLEDLAALDGMIRAHRWTRFVVTTGSYSTGQALAVAQMGASGYLHRDGDLDVIRRVLDAISHGELWLPRPVLSGLVETLRRSTLENARARSLGPAVSPLNNREREVYAYVLRGAPNKAIADQLGIRECTVKCHLTHIYRKLGVSSRLQLAVSASQQPPIDLELDTLADLRSPCERKGRSATPSTTPIGYRRSAP